jgi:hypothetical protein
MRSLNGPVQSVVTPTITKSPKGGNLQNGIVGNLAPEYTKRHD